MRFDADLGVNRWAVLVVAGFAYFVAFPTDFDAVLGPVERILNLTSAVSPWLYVVVGAGVVAWAITRTFPARRTSNSSIEGR